MTTTIPYRFGTVLITCSTELFFTYTLTHENTCKVLAKNEEIICNTLIYGGNENELSEIFSSTLDCNLSSVLNGIDSSSMEDFEKRSGYIIISALILEIGIKLTKENKQRLLNALNDEFNSDSLKTIDYIHELNYLINTLKKYKNDTTSHYDTNKITVERVAKIITDSNIKGIVSVHIGKASEENRKTICIMINDDISNYKEVIGDTLYQYPITYINV